MSWQDRPYHDDNSYGSSRSELRLQLPRPSLIVGWLVVINIAVHFIQLIALNLFHIPFGDWFGLSWAGLANGRVWQLVSYMFVHSPDSLFHILFNMLMLYFIGRVIELDFGPQRFLKFYFACGLLGGVAYLILSGLVPAYRGIPVVGASGAIWGLLIAAMIFYPSMQIIFLVFPMPIRVFGALMLGIFLFNLIGEHGGDNFGGDICHLGGAIAGIGVLYAWGMMPRITIGSGDGPLSRWAAKRNQNAWARRQQILAEEQAQVDHILEKVHREGIASLTRSEKKTLATATRNQQQREEGRSSR